MRDCTRYFENAIDIRCEPLPHFPSLILLYMIRGFETLIKTWPGHCFVRLAKSLGNANFLSLSLFFFSRSNQCREVMRNAITRAFLFQQGITQGGHFGGKQTIFAGRFGVKNKRSARPHVPALVHSFRPRFTKQERAAIKNYFASGHVLYVSINMMETSLS